MAHPRDRFGCVKGLGLMLKIQDLTIQYGTQPPVVSGFQLSMKKGEIVSIVGESGSGKTTVIRAVLGALPGAGHIAGGDILFHGQSLRDKTPEDWRKIRGSQISMIFQSICRIPAHS